MIKVIIFFCCAIVFSFADQITGKVVDVHDGDTITLLVEKTQHKIRLDAIDAPEAKQAFGEASRKSLAKLVAGKQVTVTFTKRDRYKRILGTVTVGGVEANFAQVSSGMAWHFRDYNKEQRYALAQEKAREQKLGLWVDKAPVAPWDFRKAAKK
jgi:micrococcal nuclease